MSTRHHADGRIESEQTTDCDRCGRDRPADPRRLTVTFTDQTDATLQDERLFFCRDCWEQLLGGARGVMI